MTTTVARPRPRGITVRVVDVRPPIIVKTELCNFQSVVQQLTGKRKSSSCCEDPENQIDDAEFMCDPKCSSSPSTETTTLNDNQEGHDQSNIQQLRTRVDEGSISTNWSTSLSSDGTASPVPQQEVTSNLVASYRKLEKILDHASPDDVEQQRLLSIKRPKLITNGSNSNNNNSDHYIVSMESLVSDLLSTDAVYNCNNQANTTTTSATTSMATTDYNLYPSSFNDHFEFSSFISNNHQTIELHDPAATSFHEFGELDKYPFPLFM